VARCVCSELAILVTVLVSVVPVYSVNCTSKSRRADGLVITTELADNVTPVLPTGVIDTAALNAFLASVVKASSLTPSSVREASIPVPVVGVDGDPELDPELYPEL